MCFNLVSFFFIASLRRCLTFWFGFYLVRGWVFRVLVRLRVIYNTLIHYYLIWFGVITILFYLLGRTSFMRIYRIVLRIVLLTLSVVCIDRAAIYIVFWKVKDYSVLMCFTLFIVWEYIYRSIEVVWYHRLWGPCYYCTLVLAKIYYYPALSTFTTIKDH